jgi:hypothetical protein
MSGCRFALGVVPSGVFLVCSAIAYAQDGTCGTTCPELVGPPAGITSLSGDPLTRLGPGPLFSIALTGDFVVGGSNTRVYYPPA